MTTNDAIEYVMKQDLRASFENRPDIRKRLWRILDALAGWGSKDEAAYALDLFPQTKEVKTIRGILGIEERDAPLWAGRI